MSSLLKNLSKTTERQAELAAERQRQADLVANAAFESELVELHNEVEENLEEMKDIAADIATKNDDVMDNVVVSNTLTDLVDQTMQTYGAAGIDEQGAQLLNISVEAVLKSAGLDIPASTLVPSFESGMSRAEYSVEAEEKKSSLVSRMWTWLIEAFKSMWEAVSSFFNSFRTNASSVEAYAKKVKEKVDKLPRGSEGKEVDAGKNAVYLTDGNGSYKDPATVLRSDMTHYQKFAQLWDSSFGGILKIDIGPSLVKMSPEQMQRMNEQLTAAVGSMIGGGSVSLQDVQFVNTHKLNLVGGADPEFKMIGAKLTIEQSAKAPSGKAPALTLMEMDSGVSTAVAAVEAMKKIQTSIDGWLKHASKIKNFANTSIGFVNMVGGGTQAKQFIKVMKTLVAANSVMSSGWSKTAPIFLTSIKANVRYIEMSAGDAAKNVPEMRTLNPAKAIGSDAA